MSKNAIIFLPRAADHCRITGKEEADALAKEVILITETTEREISYCQNHNLIEFEEEEEEEEDYYYYYYYYDDDSATDVQ